MAKVQAYCRTSCRDGKANKPYYLGEGPLMIDPMDPIAQYFVFPPGTKKYSKRAKDGFVIEGENSFFPPQVQVEEEEKEEPEDE